MSIRSDEQNIIAARNRTIKKLREELERLTALEIKQSKQKMYCEKCESCGEEFANHLGIIGTCQELRRVTAENERLREALEDCLSTSVDAPAYPDGPCLEKWVRDQAKQALEAKDDSS